MRLKNVKKPVRRQLKRCVLEYMPRGVSARIESMMMKRSIRNRRKLVSEEELEKIYRDALLLLAERNDAEALGDYFDFGAYNGTSLACRHQVLKDLSFDNVRLFGSDSFEGLQHYRLMHSGQVAFE